MCNDEINFKRKLKDILEKLEDRLKKNSIESINLNKREDLKTPPIPNLVSTPKFGTYKIQILEKKIKFLYNLRDLIFYGANPSDIYNMFFNLKGITNDQLNDIFELFLKDYVPIPNQYPSIKSSSFWLRHFIRVNFDPEGLICKINDHLKTYKSVLKHLKEDNK